MKAFFSIVFFIPLAFLLLGSSHNAPEKESNLNITKAVVEIPRDDLPEVKHPVVIQIEHQGFPFDISGNFPYVVMVDNRVYRCNKDDVRLFLEKIVTDKPFVPGRVQGLN